MPRSVVLASGFSYVKNGASYIVVAGGYNEDQLNMVMESTNTATDGTDNTGAIWTPLANTPFNRHQHTAFATITSTNEGNLNSPYNYIFHVIGGLTASSVVGDVWSTTDLTNTSSWVQHASVFPARYQHGTAVWDGGNKILVQGGSSNGAGLLSDTLYSSNGGASFTYTLAPQNGVGSWSARWGFAYSQVPLAAGGMKIYMMGGSINSGFQTNSDVWSTSDAGNTWVKSAQSIPEFSCVGCRMVYVASLKKIFVVGGRDTNNMRGVISADCSDPSKELVWTVDAAANTFQKVK